MTKTTRFLQLCAITVALLAGCASTERRPAPTAERPPAAEADPQNRPIFDARGGARADLSAIAAQAATADALIIGELHGHPVGLRLAADLWDQIAESAPTAALALEFFDRDEQTRIDEYLGSLVDEETFARRTSRSASTYPDGHRRMLETARRLKLPVLAANAPRPYVRFARAASFDGLRTLSAAQQALFRIPDALPDGRYREAFDAIMTGMGGHGDGVAANDMLDGMFRAQSLWDWTMADTVARALDAGRRPVVLVVGQFHSDHDGGLLQALRMMRPGANVLTISMAGVDSSALRPDDLSRATFVAYVGPAAPPQAQ